MAQKINLSLSTYCITFATGQVSLGRTGNYTQYAIDLDTNFTTLRTTINQIVDEINAVQGPNAGLGGDLLIYDDPARGAPSLTGFVGLHSYFAARTITSIANDSIILNPGIMMVNNTAVRNTAGATFVGSGGARTRYFAIDLNGALYQ